MRSQEPADCHRATLRLALPLAALLFEWGWECVLRTRRRAEGSSTAGGAAVSVSVQRRACEDAHSAVHRELANALVRHVPVLFDRYLLSFCLLAAWWMICLGQTRKQENRILWARKTQIIRDVGSWRHVTMDKPFPERIVSSCRSSLMASDLELNNFISFGVLSRDGVADVGDSRLCHP